MFGSASTAPQLETKFLASLAPPMLACAAPGKYISRTAALLARSPLFEKFSLQRNFQGLLSIVQLSRFLSFFSCDSFDILSNLFRFVKNFFIFLFCLICFPFGPLQATACIGYHINKALSTVFSCPRLFRLRVSG